MTMNKYAKDLCDATLTMDKRRILRATQAYMQAMADALDRVQHEFACPIKAPSIVVAEAFANSLKLNANETTLASVEALHKRCRVMTVSVAVREDLHEGL